MITSELIEIDPADSTLPDNYLQLKAALEKDCAKYDEQSAAKKNKKHSNQAGWTLTEKRYE